jgi:hypothetical protein
VLGNLVSLNRWHWMVIALLVGAAAGYVAQPTSLDLRSEYGDVINGQKDFESAVVKEVQGVKRFKDLVVHRQSVPVMTGGSRYVWVVSGRYCSGVPDRSDGKLHWKLTSYVAPEPYYPKSKLAELVPSASAAAIGKWQNLDKPTVLNFLQLMNETSGVQYSHAWWRSYAMATWFMASIILLGVVVPTTIDLVVYGRFIRPREEKGTKLTPSPAAPAIAKAEMTAEERGRLAALEAAMEEGLKEAATSTAVTSSTAPAKPVRKLNGQPDLAPVPTAAKDARTFGAKPDDYYPTEQKGKSASVKPRG